MNKNYRFFSSIRKSKKGVASFELIKQVLCFMVDGTSRHLTYFNQLAKDPGYAGSIETDMAQMASSHQIKRFFKAFAWTDFFVSSVAANTVHLASENKAAKAYQVGYRIPW